MKGFYQRLYKSYLTYNDLLKLANYPYFFLFVFKPQSIDKNYLIVIFVLYTTFVCVKKKFCFVLNDLFLVTLLGKEFEIINLESIWGE